MRIKDRKVAKNIIITIVIFIVIGKGALFLIQEKRESLEKAMVTFLQKEMEQASLATEGQVTHCTLSSSGSREKKLIQWISFIAGSCNSSGKKTRAGKLVPCPFN